MENDSKYRKRAKTFHEAIKNILLNEWDPIGVSDIDEANDEYDSYVPALYKMLLTRKPVHEIFAYLWQLETEHMELSGDRQHTEMIAERLLSIRDELID